MAWSIKVSRQVHTIPSQPINHIEKTCHAKWKKPRNIKHVSHLPSLPNPWLFPTTDPIYVILVENSKEELISLWYSRAPMSDRSVGGEGVESEDEQRSCLAAVRHSRFASWQACLVYIQPGKFTRNNTTSISKQSTNTYTSEIQYPRIILNIANSLSSILLLPLPICMF